MKKMKTDDYAKNAKVAVDAYNRHVYEKERLEGSGFMVVSDLVADIMHFCDKKKLDFEKVLDKARYYYKGDW